MGNAGTVFRMTPAGSLTNLSMFINSNGANPYSGLIQGTDGSFYGTTEQGGTNGGWGVVFQVTTNGALSTLISFNNTNGSTPMGELVQGTDGNFYGTTQLGGTNGGSGTVYKITTNGALTTLVSFNTTNGANPIGALVQATDGSFFGTTSAGGANGLGTVFQLSNGTMTTLVSFNGTNGASPLAGLVRGTDGNYYGTTSAGGTGNAGTVFCMSPAGASTLSASFNTTNGAYPAARLIQGADGNFYGTTRQGGTNGGFGTVFQMTPAGALTSLYSFSVAVGDHPLAGLAVGADGNLYGTAQDGGIGPDGIAFRLSVPMAPKFRNVTQTGGTLNFTWSAVAGQMYQLQSISDLTKTNWSNLGGFITATNGTMTGSDVVAPGSHFYRIQLLSP